MGKNNPIYNAHSYHTKVPHKAAMTRLLPVLLLALILVACGAQPSPTMLGATRADVMRDGRQYTVYYTETRVEVIRRGYAARADFSAIRATMITLIPEVTGCNLTESTLQGDSGEMHGSIRC